MRSAFGWVLACLVSDTNLWNRLGNLTNFEKANNGITIGQGLVWIVSCILYLASICYVLHHHTTLRVCVCVMKYSIPIEFHEPYSRLKFYTIIVTYESLRVDYKVTHFDRTRRQFTLGQQDSSPEGRSTCCSTIQITCDAFKVHNTCHSSCEPRVYCTKTTFTYTLIIWDWSTLRMTHTIFSNTQITIDHYQTNVYATFPHCCYLLKIAISNSNPWSITEDGNLCRNSYGITLYLV